MLIAAAAAGAPASSAVSKGKRAYQKCYSCHALEPGAAKLEGPSLHRIVGRRVGAERGFAYSAALRRFARRHPRWTRRLVDRYAADPEALVPGTTMTFHGIKDARERRALIQYLERAAEQAR